MEHDDSAHAPDGGHPDPEKPAGDAAIEDAAEAAVLLQQAGLDLLDISGGFCGYVHPTVKEEGYFAEITRTIRTRCSLPLILTGGIVTPAAADRLLAEDAADLMGVGRALLKDSRWAVKAVS